MSPMASSCRPEVEKYKPPRLINGEWIQEAKPSATELAIMDFEKLSKYNFNFFY